MLPAKKLKHEKTVDQHRGGRSRRAIRSATSPEAPRSPLRSVRGSRVFLPVRPLRALGRSALPASSRSPECADYDSGGVDVGAMVSLMRLFSAGRGVECTGLVVDEDGIGGMRDRRSGRLLRRFILDGRGSPLLQRVARLGESTRDGRRKCRGPLRRLKHFRLRLPLSGVLVSNLSGDAAGRRDHPLRSRFVLSPSNLRDDHQGTGSAMGRNHRPQSRKLVEEPPTAEIGLRIARAGRWAGFCDDQVQAACPPTSAAGRREAPEVGSMPRAA